MRSADDVDPPKDRERDDDVSQIKKNYQNKYLPSLFPIPQKYQNQIKPKCLDEIKSKAKKCEIPKRRK